MRAKRELPRIERDIEVEVQEDANAHLWAVSYADFLMALLSFFILFYSVDDQKREQLILNISNQLAKDSVLNGAAAGTAGSAAMASQDPLAVQTGSPAQVRKNLVNALQGLEVKIEEENQHLIINFPDDIFSNGSYRLTEGNKNQLTRFLEIARPYNGKFNLFFEGHTDSKPIRKTRTTVITDNYILSSLRASSALQLAVTAGFDEKFLFTQANSSNVRNSRSLSIRLELRKETI